MSFFEEQLVKIGVDMSVSAEEQIQQTKEILEYDRFVPSSESVESPCECSHLYENPAIGAHCCELDWDGGWFPVDETGLLSVYPEYIPTDEAVDTLSELQPILEVGAGSGYWAYVLENAGVDIVATDPYPVDVSREYLSGECETISRSGPRSVELEGGAPKLPWTEIKIADHTVIQECSGKTVMSCHPPADSDWNKEMLDLIDSGQQFVFVGGWYPSPDATPFFFDELKEWELLDMFPVYDWRTMHAHGYVFQKP
jgi:hypothetical protein